MKNDNTFFNINTWFILIILFIVSSLFAGCNRSRKDVAPKNSSIQGELIIFHAGSLSVPFKQIAAAFKESYPGVDVYLEAAGSVACARKITDLNRPCDIMASADYQVIDKFLIPDYAAWNIKFAGNEMVIAYFENSTFSEEINALNWYDILRRDDAIIGRSDPNQDPCGYRAVLTMKLAEKMYQIPGLARQLQDKNRNYIRPKEVDLIALLETNAIDYMFIYRSVAKQHGLKYILLPDEINLGNPDFKDDYSTVSVEINGKTPQSKVTMNGEPMIYGVTILNEAPNKKIATLYLEFLLTEDKGLDLLEEAGQPPLPQIISNNYSHIPKSLQKFVSHK
ncbi:MAG: tungstate ABC transporter substrate-binding protein WtpA [Bacteroidales bacterium]|nr:tungstate ABC transporter substrate-binding protein WtpA [Bacteroidales bacterium]